MPRLLSHPVFARGTLWREAGSDPSPFPRYQRGRAPNQQPLGGRRSDPVLTQTCSQSVDTIMSFLLPSQILSERSWSPWTLLSIYTMHVTRLKKSLCMKSLVWNKSLLFLPPSHRVTIWNLRHLRRRNHHKLRVVVYVDYNSGKVHLTRWVRKVGGRIYNMVHSSNWYLQYLCNVLSQYALVYALFLDVCT